MRYTLAVFLFLMYTVFAKELVLDNDVYKKLKHPYEKQRYIAVMLDDKVPAVDFQKKIIDIAIGFLGIKYRFGGETINGLDCSSFVQKVYKLAGAELPRTARYQALYGVTVDKSELKPGDLLFFQTYAKFPSHVGIYIGEGKMIHASARGKKITVSNINSPYFKKRFLFAKRIFLYDPTIAKITSVKVVEDEKN